MLYSAQDASGTPDAQKQKRNSHRYEDVYQAGGYHPTRSRDRVIAKHPPRHQEDKCRRKDEHTHSYRDEKTQWVGSAGLRMHDDIGHYDDGYAGVEHA